MPGHRRGKHEQKVQGCCASSLSLALFSRPQLPAKVARPCSLASLPFLSCCPQPSRPRPGEGVTVSTVARPNDGGLVISARGRGHGGMGGNSWANRRNGGSVSRSRRRRFRPRPSIRTIQSLAREDHRARHRRKEQACGWPRGGNCHPHRARMGRRPEARSHSRPSQPACLACQPSGVSVRAVRACVSDGGDGRG